jgi:hypothetical protein
MWAYRHCHQPQLDIVLISLQEEQEVQVRSAPLRQKCPAPAEEPRSGRSALLRQTIQVKKRPRNAVLTKFGAVVYAVPAVQMMHAERKVPNGYIALTV